MIVGVTSPKGFFASAIRAGIKQKGLDLALISSPSLCNAAGVVTQNSVKAAPVLLSKIHLKDGYSQAIVVNSGCANACTGAEGMEHAKRMCEKTGDLLGISGKDVLVASTGVIGKRLPIEKIEKVLPDLAENLDTGGGEKASLAILTTDTRPKVMKTAFKIGGKIITLGGMAKGAGMISPEMATLLCFVTTDCNIISPLLREALKETVEDSFNQLVIDGDMSTNDSLFILANGRAENSRISRRGSDYFKFKSGLGELLEGLSYQIASDAEGATRLIEATIINAGTLKQARDLSRDIVTSLLVKSMVFGYDPNFGRILAAIGRRGNIDERKVKLWIQAVKVFHLGIKTRFDEKALSGKMKSKKVSFLVDIGAGRAQAKALGCDLTPGYVRINANYN